MNDYTYVKMDDYVKCSGMINNIQTKLGPTNLYITDQFGASDKSQLDYYQIKHVFNISPVKLREHSGINYYHLPIADDSKQDILQYFDKIFEQMDKIILQKQNLVINCQAGVSRSASFVLGYLIKNGLNYESSYQLLKSCRPVINPNKGFIEQLKQYENNLSKKV